MFLTPEGRWFGTSLLFFGQKIEVPKAVDHRLLDDLLPRAAKRTEEREILRDFLMADSVDGNQRFSEIALHAEQEAAKLVADNGFSFNKEPVINFCVSELKRQKLSDGVSLYHDLVYQLVQEANPKLRSQLRKLKLGKVEVTDLPETFPSQFNIAEALLIGKLRSEVGLTEYQQYEKRKQIDRLLRLAAKDLFFGINHGLNSKEARDFVSLMYQLRRRQVALLANESALKERVADAIHRGSVLKLIHIKCLRFVYPYGEEVVLLDHIDDAEVATKSGGTHKPLSEKELFSRLGNLRSLFSDFGVNIKQLILISDQDLEDYFPKNGNNVFPEAMLEKARLAMARYKKAVAEAANGAEVYYLREYLDQIGTIEKFDQARASEMSLLASGKAKLAEGFIEEKVNYRFESNRKILAFDPGREFARARVNAQLASMQALRFLDQDGVILVEENRGNDNQFIGGVKKSALPVYFMRLRDDPE